LVKKIKSLISAIKSSLKIISVLDQAVGIGLRWPMYRKMLWSHERIFFFFFYS